MANASLISKGSIIDLYGQPSGVTSNPPAGEARIFYDSVNNVVHIIDSNGNDIVALSKRVASLNFIIDGAGSTPSTGVRGQINIPTGCTLTGWVLTADQSGSGVVDVLRSTYAGFPSTSSIAGTDKPTLSSVQKNENLGPLSGWTSTALSAGDQLQINLNSVTTCTLLCLTLNVTIP